jgi:hypothetical protein
MTATPLGLLKKDSELVPAASAVLWVVRIAFDVSSLASLAEVAAAREVFWGGFWGFTSLAPAGGAAQVRPRARVRAAATALTRDVSVLVKGLLLKVPGTVQLFEQPACHRWDGGDSQSLQGVERFLYAPKQIAFDGLDAISKRSDIESLVVQTLTH